MHRRSFLSAAATLALAPSLATAATEGDTGVFERPEPAGATDEPQRVFYHRPTAWQPDGRIVMVMHGFERDADRYRDDWAPLADKYGFLLVCPEFSNAKFPLSEWYNYGGLRATLDPNLRAFAVLDRVFADSRRRFNARASRYSLYGHSAGAQFTHRFLLLAPSAFVDQAVSANAGWYTLPVFDEKFPYGLQDSPVTEAQVEQFFRRPLVLQLGEMDTNPHHPTLRRNAAADRQGPHRYARGLNFFAVAKREAAERGIPLAWRLVTVPGVNHSDAKMAASAAAVLFS